MLDAFFQRKHEIPIDRCWCRQHAFPFSYHASHHAFLLIFEGGRKQQHSQHGPQHADPELRNSGRY
jgi:hypothetical protein